MTDWWPVLGSAGDIELRLFCLPYAGGRASIFRDWRHELPLGVEVRALALPGRGERFGEPPIDDVAMVVRAAADAMEPLLDHSYALFGHSMGAILAFELARELRCRDASAPVLVIVAGQNAPDLIANDAAIHELPDGEFAEELRRLAGTPPEILGDPEIMALLLPSLRADFRICETYAFAPQAPLDAPLMVINSLGDTETTEAGIERWSTHSSADVTHVTLPGDHFFLHAAERPLLQAIGSALTTRIGAR